MNRNLYRRIRLFSLDALPDVSEIRKLLTECHGITFEIMGYSSSPISGATREAILATLREQLPGYRVQGSGLDEYRLPGNRHSETTSELDFCVREHISIKNLPSPELVRATEREIVAAAAEYRRMARVLMVRLANYLEIPLTAFWDGSIPLDRPTGDLEGGWHYAYHGLQFRFTNATTGQVVNASMGYENEFGLLDSYYFVRFMNATPPWTEVPRKFVDPEGYIGEILYLLEKRGALQRIQSVPAWDASGLTVLDLPEE